MKIEFWVIGKTTPNFIVDGVEVYEKRIKHYCKFEAIVFPYEKHAGKMNSIQLKLAEAKKVIEKLSPQDFLVLLDEKGKNLKSTDFAKELEKWQQNSYKRIIFLVGGAYGVHSDIVNRANYKLSMSNGTFSHQLIRIIFLEQLYRAFTIIKGEKYHNE